MLTPPGPSASTGLEDRVIAALIGLGAVTMLFAGLGSSLLVLSARTSSSLATPSLAGWVGLLPLGLVTLLVERWIRTSGPGAGIPRRQQLVGLTVGLGFLLAQISAWGIGPGSPSGPGEGPVWPLVRLIVFLHAGLWFVSLVLLLRTLRRETTRVGVLASRLTFHGLTCLWIPLHLLIAASGAG